MRSFKVLIYLLFLVLSISTFAHVSLAKKVGFVHPLVKKWCNTTSYPHLCISTIAPHVKGKPTLHDALDIAIKAGIRYTEKTISVTEKMAKNPPPSVGVDILTGAIEMLGDALDSYNKAQVYLNQHRDQEINIELSAVLTDISTALEPDGPDPGAKEIYVPVLTRMLHKGNKLAVMCLGLDALNYPRQW